MRVHLSINMSPWVPRIWIGVWVLTYDRILRRPVNRYVPKIPPFQGGENVIRLTLSWVIDRSFTLVPQQVVPSHLASSRTRVRIPLRTFLSKEVLARASYYKHVSQGPQDLDRSLGRHVRPHTETRQPIRPKDSSVQKGGKV